MIIREIGASLRALFARLSSKTTTIAGTETVYLDDAGSSVKAALSDAIRYGGGNSTRVTTIGNANIHQKSDGTMWLEVTGQTAGNARGAGAFDWQATRTGATQVASGAGAVAIGIQNVASGSNAAVIGASSSAIGDGSVVLGFQNAATGTFAVAMGGRYCNALNRGQIVLSSNSTFNTTSGEMQANIQGMALITTDAVPTPLRTDSGNVTYRMVIPATRSCAFIGIVQAMCNVSSSSNFIKAWKIEGVITRDGNNTTRIVGTPIITVMAQDTDGTQTPSTWAITSITADDTNESLAINVTGQTGQTIRWQASLFYSQVGF